MEGVDPGWPTEDSVAFSPIEDKQDEGILLLLLRKMFIPKDPEPPLTAVDMATAEDNIPYAAVTNPEADIVSPEGTLL